MLPVPANLIVSSLTTVLTVLSSPVTNSCEIYPASFASSLTLSPVSKPEVMYPGLTKFTVTFPSASLEVVKFVPPSILMFSLCLTTRIVESSAPILNRLFSIVVNLFVIVVAKFASSLRAAANSFSVFNCSGALSSTAATFASTSACV